MRLTVGILVVLVLVPCLSAASDVPAPVIEDSHHVLEANHLAAIAQTFRAQAGNGNERAYALLVYPTLPLPSGEVHADLAQKWLKARPQAQQDRTVVFVADMEYGLLYQSYPPIQPGESRRTEGTILDPSADGKSTMLLRGIVNHFPPQGLAELFRRLGLVLGVIILAVAICWFVGKRVNWQLN